MCEVANLDDEDASRPDAQFRCAWVECDGRHILPQDGEHAHRDAPRRADGDGAVAAINLDAVGYTGVSKTTAWDISCLTPLQLGDR